MHPDELYASLYMYFAKHKDDKYFVRNYEDIENALKDIESKFENEEERENFRKHIASSACYTELSPSQIMFVYNLVEDEVSLCKMNMYYLLNS